MALRNWDAFPKLEKNFQQATSSGGFLSIAVFVFLSLLVLSEFRTYLNKQQIFEFLVDQTRSHDHALQINVDVTVAMPCKCMEICFGVFVDYLEFHILVLVMWV
ncbi:Endoplasmic reticulum-Golgi intermediate compartment protein 2 [Nowakowskiella sp. JEL0407]|nr:Endoplasmic reticulum-Golgi intermediate compartment protein 2 [Nowakowskiella sp. JEL0407]